MKTLIALAVAAAFAVPAFAQQKNEPVLPTAKERAENREDVKDALPNKRERAENRETVSTAASHAALTGKVKTALASDAGMGTLVNIDVDSNGGVVTLKGKVDSADLKKKAEAIAKKVDGVKSVKNQLRVEAKKEKTS